MFLSLLRDHCRLQREVAMPENAPAKLQASTEPDLTCMR